MERGCLEAALTADQRFEWGHHKGEMLKKDTIRRSHCVVVRGKMLCDGSSCPWWNGRASEKMDREFRDHVARRCVQLLNAFAHSSPTRSSVLDNFFFWSTFLFQQPWSRQYLRVDDFLSSRPLISIKRHPTPSKLPCFLLLPRPFARCLQHQTSTCTRH